MSRRFLLLSAGVFAAGCGCNPQPAAPVQVTEMGQRATPVPAITNPPAEPRPADGESDTVRKYKQRVKELGEAAEAGRISLIQELLKAGADVNDKDDAGRTALHKAAAKGHQGACVALLAYGADSGESDADGVTPLMLAAGGGHERVVALMKSPALVTQSVGEVLKDAAKGVLGNERTFVDKMLTLGSAAGEKTDKLGQTAAHKAAANGHARCLVACGTDRYGYATTEGLGQLDKAGSTPLMLAAANGHTDVFAAYNGDPKLAVPLAVKSPDGKTAFDLARENKRTAVLTALEPFRVLVDAAAGDTTAVEKAYKAEPAKFPAGEVMRVAARNKQLPVLKLVLGWYADKPAAEKTSLLAFTNSWNAYNPLYIAAQADWAEGVWEMVNPKWWNDGPALKAFIIRDVTGVNILDSYYEKQSPGSVAAVLKALTEAEKK